MGPDDSAQLSELRDLIARRTPNDDHQTAIASLCLIRYSSSLTLLVGVLSPALCITQGHKEIVVGEEVYSYGPGHQLVSSLALPTSARILGVTPAKPYLGLRLNFDPASIAPLIEEARLLAPAGVGSERGLTSRPRHPLCSMPSSASFACLNTPHRF